NKIEHRLFAFLTQNWRGRPLVSYAVILSLIASTTTSTGLRVQSYLDTAAYPTGVTVSDEEMDALHIERDAFHPNWNYTVRPRTA
ncbi:MAG: ISAzo13-like element transposase-related protein, partial [Chloroflexota bacterium]